MFFKIIIVKEIHVVSPCVDVMARIRSGGYPISTLSPSPQASHGLISDRAGRVVRHLRRGDLVNEHTVR